MVTTQAHKLELKLEYQCRKIDAYTLISVCIVITFALSALMNPNKKFDMEHIQNATLAEGVVIWAPS